MSTLPKISDQGFRRIAQAAPAQPQTSAPNLQRMQEDIKSAREWIDYLSRMQYTSEEEIEELTKKVDFLESHLYDVGGKVEETPEPTTTDVTPFAPADFYGDMQREMEEYYKTLPYPPVRY